MTAEQRAAKVLAEHRFMSSRPWPDGSKPEAPDWNPGCTCGAALYYFEHEAHVTAALAAAGYPRDDREGETVTEWGGVCDDPMRPGPALTEEQARQARDWKTALSPVTPDGGEQS